MHNRFLAHSVRRLPASLLMAALAVVACEDSGGGSRPSADAAGEAGSGGHSSAAGSDVARSSGGSGGAKGEESKSSENSGSGGSGSGGSPTGAGSLGGGGSGGSLTSAASGGSSIFVTGTTDTVPFTAGKNGPDAGAAMDAPLPDVSRPADSSPPDSAPVSCHQEGLAAITQALLRADIATLSSAEFEGRKTGTAGERKAIDYIVGQYKAAGLDGVSDKYEQAFKVSGVSGSNTVAVLAGSDSVLKDEVIVVGAHHDHMGKTSTGYYPGADDNASGASAVMALGRAFAKCRGQLKRTLVFMTYGGEEQGVYGSYYYTKVPLFPLAKTMYMVNHDMLGYVSKNKLEVSWGTTFAKDTLTAACMKTSICKLIQSDMKNEQGTDSDTFAAVKVPYTGFFAGYSDCYHETCDTVDKLDMAGVTDATKLSFDLVYALATTSKGLSKTAARETGMVIDRSLRPFRDHRRAPAAQ